MKIAFVGGGNMAGALIGGMIEAGFATTDMDVLEIDPNRCNELSKRYQIRVHPQAGRWLNDADTVILAVKPQQLQEVAASIKSELERPLVLSIAAGIRATTIADWLANPHVVRAMPNMPALVRAGISGAVALPEVTAEQKSSAHQILSAVGSVIWIDDETMLDAVTAVSGSGPAYVFYFIEAMQTAACELGFDQAQAKALVLQTFLGAAQVAAQSDEPVAALRANVTSKGGTTAAAIASLDSDKVNGAVRRALHAAAQRATELGAIDPKQPS